MGLGLARSFSDLDGNFHELKEYPYFYQIVYYF